VARLAIVASGTLGDILPVARLFEVLKDRHEITVLTSERYFRWFEGAECAPLPYDPQVILHSTAGQRLMEGGWLGTRRLRGLYGVVKPHLAESARTARRTLPGHDLAVTAGIPFMTGILSEEMQLPMVRLLFQPHWPNAEVRSLFFSTSRNFTPTINRISHSLVEVGARAMFGRHIRGALGWPRSRVLRNLTDDSFWYNQPTIFLLSRSFTHAEIDASPRAEVAGFIRPPAMPATDEFRKAVLDVQRASRPVVYVGFGPMQTPKTARLLCDFVRAAQGRDVLLAVQGRARDIPASDQVIAVPAGDHRALFPHCHGIIHHGGAGTTVAAMDAGRPFAIVPQWFDQYYWSYRTAQLGVSVPVDFARHGMPTCASDVLDSLLRRQGQDEAFASCLRNVAGADGTHDAVDRIERELR
jgi:UDP:flavonoid glycosyltransferase YjiC (YdhE family)